MLASIKLLNVTLANYICSLNRSFAFVAIYVLPMWILNSLPQLNLFTSFLYLTERLCSLEHRLLSINTKSFVKISLNTIHLCFHFPGKNSSVGCHSTFMPPNKRWVWRCGQRNPYWFVCLEPPVSYRFRFGKLKVGLVVLRG